MKKILIIGVESFTGKHLSNYFEKNNFCVYGTSLKYIENNNIFQCDITIKIDIQSIIQKIKPDYIINLAAISFVGNENNELFYKINVLAVENILQAITEIENYSPLKVILISSATVYGNQAIDILNEDMTPNPINHYGVSKLAMEQVAKTYFNKLNIIITRPFNYTGIGQENQFLIPKIVQHFKDNKKEIELGNIDVYREFNDIGFICEVYFKLLFSDTQNDIYNICSNRLISLKDIITNMEQIANYKINIKINPKFVRKNEIKSLSGSNKKLFKFIGQIEQKDFIETLKDMYND